MLCNQIEKKNHNSKLFNNTKTDKIDFNFCFFFFLHFRMWWTITGNFGNILPIDWSKSYARQMHMPALKLNQPSPGTPDNDLNDLSSEDEAVANDLDMHALILGGLHTDDEPIKSAEEVIKEIDDIMDETDSSDNDGAAETSEVMEKAKEVLGSPLYEDSKIFLLSI